MYGGDGDDVVNGGLGSDILYSGDGLDYLGGGAGSDTLIGDGIGTNAFVLGYDREVDYVHGFDLDDYLFIEHLDRFTSEVVDGDLLLRADGRLEAVIKRADTSLEDLVSQGRAHDLSQIETLDLRTSSASPLDPPLTDSGPLAHDHPSTDADTGVPSDAGAGSDTQNPTIGTPSTGPNTGDSPPIGTNPVDTQPVQGPDGGAAVEDTPSTAAPGSLTSQSDTTQSNVPDDDDGVSSTEQAVGIASVLGSAFFFHPILAFIGILFLSNNALNRDIGTNSSDGDDSETFTASYAFSLSEVIPATSVIEEDLEEVTSADPTAESVDTVL